MAIKIAYCLTSHAGGYGDCILPPGHRSAHQDAFGYKFRDEDNDKIVLARAASRADAILAKIN
jgi:hypothetical protein